MDEEKSILGIEIHEAEELYSFVRGEDESLELPPEGVPPHLTLQFPWKAPSEITDKDIIDLNNLFSNFKPFSFTLKIGWFGQEVLILEPENPEVFIRITSKILETWPEHKYYAGEYNDIEPHVTLAYGNSANLEELAGKLVDFLPIQGTCSEIVLSVGIPGQMKNHKVFRL